mgnify:CR=1 FL=1
MIVNTNDSNFARDSTSGALINTNVLAYKLHKQQRGSLQQAETMQGEIESLKDEVAQLKQLIGQLVQNVSINNTN